MNAFVQQMTHRLTTHAGWNPAVVSRDFNAFISEIDYGYDTDSMVIDWSQGDLIPKLAVLSKSS